jgi:hypothetical protein
VHFLLQFRRRLPTELVDKVIDEAEYWPCIVTSTHAPHDVPQDRDIECVRTPSLCWDLPPSASASAQSLHQSFRLLSHRGKHPARKIVFSISSHDQGWGGNSRFRGTYRESWTWFDAYIVPHGEQPTLATSLTRPSSVSEAEPEFVPLILPGPHTLQVNRMATRETQHHHIVWHFRDPVPAFTSLNGDEVAVEAETGRGKATMDGRAVRSMRVGDQVVVWARTRFPGWRNHVEKVSIALFWAI